MYSFFRFSASSLAVILRQFALSPSYAADEQITQGLSSSLALQARLQDEDIKTDEKTTIGAIICSGKSYHCQQHAESKRTAHRYIGRVDDKFAHK